jgi:hypothetical protein
MNSKFSTVRLSVLFVYFGPEISYRNLCVVLRNWSNTHSDSTQKLSFVSTGLSSVGAYTFRVVTSHHGPVVCILSWRHSTISAPDFPYVRKILCQIHGSRFHCVEKMHIGDAEFKDLNENEPIAANGSVAGRCYRRGESHIYTYANAKYWLRGRMTLGKQFSARRKSFTLFMFSKLW